MCTCFQRICQKFTHKDETKIVVEQPVSNVRRLEDECSEDISYDRYVCAVTDLDFEQYLKLREGDMLLAPSSALEDCVRVLNPLSNRSGWVPKSVVTDKLGDCIVFDAWQDVDRDRAEVLLQDPAAKEGTFILRPSSDKHCIGFSVLFRKPSEVHHYKITFNNDFTFSLGSGKRFDRLVDIVRYICANPSTVQCNNVEPYNQVSCVEPDPPSTNFVGRGNFSSVSYEHSVNGRVAVKTLISLQPIESLIEGLGYLKSLDSPHLVRVNDIHSRSGASTGELIEIIMEAMPRGSLNHYLSSPEGQNLDEASLRSIISKVGSGMSYLEEHQIVHTHLRDTSILCDEANNFKISDVGMRRLLADSIEFSPEWFPFDSWTAPELRSNPKNFTHKTDIWAFGILMFVVYTKGKKPYGDLPDDRLPSHLAAGSRPEQTPDISDVSYNLMRLCWLLDASSRPTFSQLNSQGEYTNLGH